MLSKIKMINKKAQVADTIAWVVATIIIVILLILFIFIYPALLIYLLSTSNIIHIIV